jgi:hypothetical protein
VAGDSSFGLFTGTFTQKAAGNNFRGTLTIDYGGGDTFTAAYSSKYDPSTGLTEGNWGIIDGTGIFADATGLGTVVTQVGPGASFVFLGDVTL